VLTRNCLPPCQTASKLTILHEKLHNLQKLLILYAEITKRQTYNLHNPLYTLMYYRILGIIMHESPGRHFQTDKRCTQENHEAEGSYQGYTIFVLTDETIDPCDSK
jgi:hypothetical protein